MENLASNMFVLDTEKRPAIRFKEILEIKIEEVLEQSRTTQESALLKRKKLQTDIIAQTRTMREVDKSISYYLQDDI